MRDDALRTLLDSVRRGETPVDNAISALGSGSFELLDYAKVDHDRAARCGFPEVIFCAGKTCEQAAGIFRSLADAGGDVLATRADADQARSIRAACPEAEYHETARCVTLRRTAPAARSTASVAMVCAGTSDLPVIEEARVTCEIMGQTTQVIYDVGVAGIHRLLAHEGALREARAVVVAAGMEGALPSVVGGLIRAPVVAVPTSVGYGASFGGLAALLAMLNSCAPGVAVVNIDNGFGAGYMAAMIARTGDGGDSGADRDAPAPPGRDA